MLNPGPPAPSTARRVAPLALLFLLLTLWSFSQLTATEYALAVNLATLTLHSSPYDTPGLYFLSPICKFIRFPKTIRTLHFSLNQPGGEVHARTRDGLPVTLGIAFQYQLLSGQSLRDLYLNLDQHYEEVFLKMGLNLITEVSTKYTAYEFFNDKQQISQKMELVLDSYFSKRLFSRVLGLQINEDVLPSDFYQAILHAANTKQNITRTEKLREAAIVQMDTDRLVAQAAANATIAQAEGEAAAIIQEGKASARNIELFLQSEAKSYLQIKEALKLNETEMAEYIWQDMLQGGGIEGRKNIVGRMVVGSPQNIILNA